MSRAMLAAVFCISLMGALKTAPMALAQAPVVGQRPADPQIAELQTGTPERKIRALQGLQYLEPARAEVVIAAVYHCLHADPDPGVRVAAYTTIAALQKQAAAKADKDIRAILNPQPDPWATEYQRQLAARAILSSPNDFPNGIESLKDFVPISRCVTREGTLIEYLQHQPYFGSGLASADGEVRQVTFAAIAEKHRQVEIMLSWYLKQPLSKSQEERVLALQTVARHFPPTGHALKLMLASLDDPDLEVAEAAIEGLTHWGEPTTPHLLREAQDKSSKLRASAYGALVTNRPPTTEILGALSEAVVQEDDNLASSAVWALAKLKEQAAPAVPALLQRLAECQEAATPEGYSPHVSVVSALTAIGPAAKEADGELQRLLDRVSTNHHPDIARALAAIHADPEVARPILTRAMESAARDMNHSEMRHTMDVANTLSLNMESLLPTFISYLEAAHDRRGEDEKKQFTPRQQAVWQTVDVLGKMGPAADSAVPVLKKIADDPGFKDDSLRKKLARALEGIQGTTSNSP